MRLEQQTFCRRTRKPTSRQTFRNSGKIMSFCKIINYRLNALMPVITKQIKKKPNQPKKFPKPKKPKLSPKLISNSILMLPNKIYKNCLELKQMDGCCYWCRDYSNVISHCWFPLLLLQFLKKHNPAVHKETKLNGKRQLQKVFYCFSISDFIKHLCQLNSPKDQLRPPDLNLPVLLLKSIMEAAFPLNPVMPDCFVSTKSKTRLLTTKITTAEELQNK